jgi:hypothetical protein
MVVDIDNYDILLGLDFLIKMGAVVDRFKYAKRNHPVQGSSPW